MGQYRVGVDLGGTKTEAVLLDGQVPGSEEGEGADPGRLCRDRGRHLRRWSRRVADGLPGGLGSVDSIGICTPGTEYGPDRLIANSNTPSLRDRPLRRDIREALRRDDVSP